MKRFYKIAEARVEGGVHLVCLDGRPVRTPAKALLSLPTAGLAATVAAEWAAQGEEVRPTTMPLMGLSCTALDLVLPKRAEVAAEVAGYGAHDLICYRAGDDQPVLAARQRDLWQPLLDWASLQLDAPLLITEGVVSVAQPAASLAALRAEVERHEGFALTGLREAVQVCGSLVIGLALRHGRLTVEQAFEAAQVDETYQMELWGEDGDALERRVGLHRDLEAAAGFLALLENCARPPRPFS